MAIQASIITRDMNEISQPTENVYESVSIISKRARQISSNLKEELEGDDPPLQSQTIDERPRHQSAQK